MSECNYSGSTRSGTNRSYSDSDRRDHERLFAARGTSLSYPTASVSGGVPAPSGNWTYPTSTGSFSAIPSSTPGPGPLKHAQGAVPRDLSAAVGAPSLLVWDLRAEGQLWRLDHGGAWQLIPNRAFLVAPISVQTSDTTQTAVSVDAHSGRTVYMHFLNGAWGDWQELDFTAEFLRRPAVVSRAQGSVDIVNVASNGHIWAVSFDGEKWSAWSDLGTGFSSDAALTSWGADRMDIFCKQGKTVLHKSWTSTSGWANEWTSLGDPFAGQWSIDTASSPLAVSWLEASGGVIDLVINSGGSSHKLFRNGAWSDWLGMYASHEGYEFPDTQSIARSDASPASAPFAHLLSRGTNNCIHHTSFNGTVWSFWRELWCNYYTGDGQGVDYPTQFLPTFTLGTGEGGLDLLARDLKGRVLKMSIQGDVSQDHQVSNEDWEDLGVPGV